VRRNQRRGLSPFAAGAITLVVIGVLVYFGFTKENPFASPRTITAAFRTANDLKPKSPVRVAGVNVGKVTDVRGAGDGGAGVVVTMELDDEAPAIKRDAELKIRPRIFLEGNYFVDLKPGSPSAPKLREDETVPVQQTASPVQLGQVLSTLQSDTRADLKRILRELGSALSRGGAQGFNRSIQWWEPAFRNSAIANRSTLGLLEHDLSGYIRHAGTVAAALDRDGEALKGLVRDLAATAGAFAQESSSLSEAVRRLPPTLRQAYTTLGTLNRAFPDVRAFVADARPAIRAARPALDAQLPFIRQARGLVSRPELRGLVADLRPTVPSLVRLNEGGARLQEQTRALSSCYLGVFEPVASAKLADQAFPATGPVYQEAVKWLPGIAAESRSYDANGQWVRSLAQAPNYAYPAGKGRFFLTQDRLQGVNPPKSAAPPFRNDVPCETQQPPDLRTKAGPPPAGFQVNQHAPGADAQYERAKRRAVEWLKGAIADAGLKRELRTTMHELTAGQLGSLTSGLAGGVAGR
jgi:phospholipid/cholesterol/gamma-HCH transport system substrate-binding protein